MNELTDTFVYLAKGIIYLGGVFVLVCIVLGAITLWQMVTTTLFAMSLAVKWNTYRRLKPDAREEFLKTQEEPLPNNEQTSKNRKP